VREKPQVEGAVNWPGIDRWNPWVGSSIANHTTSTFVIVMMMMMMMIEVATVEGYNPNPHFAFEC
jgi:hypothetical protein